MRLTRSARAISIRFANGVEVQVLKRGKTFLGLGRVRVQGVDLRAEERPILPAIASPDGWQVLDFELAKITERRKAVELVLKPRLVLQPKMEWACHAMHQRVPLEDYSEAAWTEPGSELRLTIRADEGKLGDLDAVGFSYAYSWRSRDRRVFQILDRATWEIGGKASGNTTIMRGAFQPPIDQEPEHPARSHDDALHQRDELAGGHRELGAQQHRHDRNSRKADEKKHGGNARQRPRARIPHVQQAQVGPVRAQQRFHVSRRASRGSRTPCPGAPA